MIKIDVKQIAKYRFLYAYTFVQSICDIMASLAKAKFYSCTFFSNDFSLFPKKSFRKKLPKKKKEWQEVEERV